MAASNLPLTNVPGPRVLIASPHPDDEILGAGCRLPLLRDASVLQVTDGSPRDLGDAHSCGRSTREEYARARKAELMEALALAGKSEVIDLEVVDQEASLQLTDLSLRVQEVVKEVRPEVILTVPYEGGHPDHDSTAFAVHSAVRKLPVRQRPMILEMTAYHNSPNGCTYNSFLGEGGEETSITLSAAECVLKRRMLDCFRSQQRVLQWFPIGVEKFRFAPAYNFLAAPHPGALYYEGFPWGMTGARWRSLAEVALENLDLITHHSLGI